MKICPKLRVSGTCLVEGCAFSHDITLFCFECNILCPNANSKSEHLIGKRHQTTLKNEPTPTIAVERHCDTCNVSISGGQEAWRIHIEGARHRKNLANSPQLDRSTPVQFYKYCDICDRSLTSIREYDTHEQSAEHQAGLHILGVATTLEYAQVDKCGISVTPSDSTIDFGHIDTRTPKDQTSWSFTLSVVASVPHIRIVDARFQSTGKSQSSGGIFSARFLAPVPLSQVVAATVYIKFWPGTSRGHLSDSLELVFENPFQRQSFTISRSVCAVVGVDALDAVDALDRFDALVGFDALPEFDTAVAVDAVVGVEDDFDLPRPTAPYVHHTKLTFSNKPILCPKPLPVQPIPYIHQLPGYPLDDSLLTVGPLDQRLMVTQTMLPRVLNGETYKQYWSTLLHIEEDQTNIDIEAYNLENVPLKQHQSFYYLKVPGLAESRPSVVIGDSVHIRSQHNPQQWFEGRVHIVRGLEVGMKFHRSFKSQPNDLCDARFTVNRIVTRREHYALDKAFISDRVLFPSPKHIKGLSRPSGQEMAAIRPFFGMIRSNMRQLEAVTAIVNRPPGSTPFIVFGPPCTGKTITIVEAIRQVLNKDPSAKILACGPSNSAADLIAQHLRDLERRQVFRLNAPSRCHSLLPDNLLSFSYKDYEDHFSIRSREDLESYRVVVSTCVSAFIPEGVGIKAGHFSHIFIDEAGQATEPEIMVPIKTMAGPSTNIVLAGDPQQLGPIIRSDVANHLGLGISFLNRLVGREVYDYRTHSGVTIVKLVKNYRNHPVILKFPNETFYNGELEVWGRPEVIISLLNSPVLARPKVPVVFHGIAGSDDREAGSPSYFNLDEISIIYKYVDQLRTDHKTRLTDKDIGIISPYYAQVKKIRKSLEAQYEGIKVGSVEEFQGQERRVILISTMRSSQDKVGYDLKHHLGFLFNPRHMNAAITCAQALLIIVGNPLTLGIDPLWRLLINYIHRNGGWRGLQPNWNVEDDDFADRFRGLGASTQMVNPAGQTLAEVLTQNIREILINEIQSVAAIEEDYDAERLEASQERPFLRDD